MRYPIYYIIIVCGAVRVYEFSECGKETRMALKKVGPNKWRVNVSVWDGAKGYSVTKQKTVLGTQSEARLVEADMYKALKPSSLTSAVASTFGDALDLHLDHIRLIGKCAPNYEKHYLHLRRELGHIRLEVFADQFERYIKTFMRTPTQRGRLPANATYNRYLMSVRAVFNRLVDLEIIDKNPITLIRFPKRREKSRDRYLTQEERLKLLNTIKQHRPYILPIVQYMMAVPCRVSELTTARKEQYSPITNTIHIPDSKAGIPIHKPVPPDMVNYFQQIPDECPWLFFRRSNSETLKVYSHLGHSLKRAWNYCLKKAGITNLRLHDLRHIAATDMILAGNSERVVMKVAGWKTNMLNTYYHNDSLFSAQKAVFANPSQQQIIFDIAV